MQPTNQRLRGRVKNSNGGMTKLYYTAPPDHIFEEVKAKVKEVWEELFDEDTAPSYKKEKLERIDIGNVRDNMMYLVAMFDALNQTKLSNKLSDEAKKAISDRIIDGGGGYDAFRPMTEFEAEMAQKIGEIIEDNE